MRVRGQRVPSSVHADTGAARDAVIKPHVGGLRLVELHIPVAVRRYLLAQLLSQTDLSEGRSVRGERPRRKGSRACRCTCTVIKEVDTQISGGFFCQVM